MWKRRRRWWNRRKYIYKRVSQTGTFHPHSRQHTPRIRAALTLGRVGGGNTSLLTLLMSSPTVQPAPAAPEIAGRSEFRGQQLHAPFLSTCIYNQIFPNPGICKANVKSCHEVHNVLLSTEAIAQCRKLACDKILHKWSFCCRNPQAVIIAQIQHGKFDMLPNVHVLVLLKMVGRNFLDTKAMLWYLKWTSRPTSSARWVSYTSVVVNPALSHHSTASCYRIQSVNPLLLTRTRTTAGSFVM